MRDWPQLSQTCRARARAIAPQRWTRARVRRRLWRALGRGAVPRARRLLRRQRPPAVDALPTYLQARAAWIPDDGARRRQRRDSGTGLGQTANDRIVARRQKRRGMHWSVQTSDALAALRTLLLNDGWQTYWRDDWFLPLTRIAA